MLEGMEGTGKQWYHKKRHWQHKALEGSGTTRIGSEKGTAAATARSTERSSRPTAACPSTSPGSQTPPPLSLPRQAAARNSFGSSTSGLPMSTWKAVEPQGKAVKWKRTEMQ